MQRDSIWSGELISNLLRSFTVLLFRKFEARTSRRQTILPVSGKVTL